MGTSCACLQKTAEGIQTGVAGQTRADPAVRRSAAPSRDLRAAGKVWPPRPRPRLQKACAALPFLPLVFGRPFPSAVDLFLSPS